MHGPTPSPTPVAAGSVRAAFTPVSSVTAAIGCQFTKFRRGLDEVGVVPVNVSTGVGPPETVSIFNRAGVGYPAKPVLTLLTLMPDVTAEN